MKQMALWAAIAATGLATATTAHASTLAYWNFDNGTAGAQVPHSTAAGVFDGTTPDASGNNNTLSTWDAGGAGFVYRADNPALPGDSASSLSVKNAGGFPAAMSIDANGNSGGGTNGLNTAALPQWTVEASYKPETGGFRTFVGRDANHVVTAAGGDANLSALYLQLTNTNALAIKYTDAAGVFHFAQTADGFGDAYDFSFPTDNEGTTGKWMNVAATSDGSTLNLYVDGVVVASTDLTASGSANTALTAGTDLSPTDDWTSGGWTVGRGLYAGGHSDRGYGFIDDVRISDTALAPSQLLAAVAPEPATLTAGLAGLIGFARRRRSR